MCRDTLSVAADGSLYDCDFNQMLDLPLHGGARIDSIELIEQQPIRWATTASAAPGQGSSCAGATA